jgi:uncharacterized membrane protein YozB (DUF420 family)
MRSFSTPDANLVSGIFFICFGAGALYLSANYPTGTAGRMGPGYFPWLIAWGTIILGAIIAAGGVLKERSPVDRIHLRAVICVSAGLVFFGLYVDRLGLLVSTVILIVLSRLGDPGRVRPIEIAILAVLASLAVSLLFLQVFNLPLTFLPR